MNIDEFGKWSPYSKDNPKYAHDEYNRSFIKERFECPDEYEGSDYDEYYSVPKMSDSFKFKREKNSSSDKESGKDKNKWRLRQNMLRQAVGLLAGSVVITASYQAAVKQQQQPPQIQPDQPAAVIVEPDKTPDDQPPEVVVDPDKTPDDQPPETRTNWVIDKNDNTAVLQILDDDGNAEKELPAVVTVTEYAATCNKEGAKVYKATIKDGNDTYEETWSETIVPLGHDFGEGEETVLANGHIGIIFRCKRCSEEFAIETSISENN